MAVDLRNRHFLKLLNFSPEELTYLLQRSADLKKAKKSGTEQQHLKGKNIALIFEKTSTTPTPPVMIGTSSFLPSLRRKSSTRLVIEKTKNKQD